MVLRAGAPAGGGPHDRPAGRVRALAGHGRAVLAGTAVVLDRRRTDHAAAAGVAVVRARIRRSDAPFPLWRVPPDPCCAATLSDEAIPDVTVVNWPQIDYWETAAARGPRIRRRRWPPAGICRCRSCTGCRPTAGYPRSAAASGHHRYGGRSGQGAVHPGVAADRGRVHRAGAARRRGGAAGRRRESRCSPTPSGSGATGSICIRVRPGAATSTSRRIRSRSRSAR